MEISQIKEYIISHPDTIGNILESANFYKVKRQGNKYWCGWNPDTIGKTIYVYVDNLGMVDFGRSVKGDIITLLENKLMLGFNGTIKWLCGILSIEYDHKPVKIIRPFGGYYMSCDTNKEESIIPMKEYSRDILSNYANKPNLMFLRDGIDIETQKEFNVGFDAMSGRITIPIFDEKGRLVGVDSRHNDRETKLYKWMPLVSFRKSQILFGYAKNYHNITHGIVFIGESPKFTMQLRSMGINNGVSLGMATITDTNAKNLQALFSKEYVLMFDEGISEEHIIRQAMKIKIDNIFLTNKVSYIYDRDNVVMLKGSKVSPSDLGKEKLKWLIDNCKVEV